LNYVPFDTHAIESDGTILKYIDHEGPLIPEEGISATDPDGNVWLLHPNYTKESSILVI